MRLVVAGGAGFIGSNFIRYVLQRYEDWHVTNFDKLTYAGNPASLSDLAGDPRYHFVRGDIADAEQVGAVLREEADVLVNFAAESHVDRSILDPALFLRTNVHGTQTLLSAALEAGVSKVVQVSTDEVYGSVPVGESCGEDDPLRPNSPYAASKAAADLLCRAYHVTFDAPVVITRCTNNYGPYQFPEKLIPMVITNALEDRPIPLYGDGQHRRDWIYVDDHCEALVRVILSAAPGSVYNIGTGWDVPNLQIVKSLLSLLGRPETLITFVKDRPGHDRRYSVRTGGIAAELGWRPQTSLEDGLARTVDWYRGSEAWWRSLKAGEYREFARIWYGR